METNVQRTVQVYQKTDVLGFQNFLMGTFKLWAANGSCVEELLKSCRDLNFEGMKCHVPQKLFGHWIG